MGPGVQGKTGLTISSKALKALEYKPDSFSVKPFCRLDDIKEPLIKSARTI